MYIIWNIEAEKLRMNTNEQGFWIHDSGNLGVQNDI